MIQGHPILNQDPRIRAMVLPVFRFDPSSPADRPFGLGTIFRIDPWGNCATAFHVIEEMLLLGSGKLGLRDDMRVAALEIEGIVYGSPPVPKDAWRPLSELHVEAGATRPPLLHQPPQILNLTELARLTFSRSHQRTPMPFLPVALGFEVPKVGDVVTGYGFAGLDLATDGKGEDRPMTQYLYESTGEVLEIVPADPASTMPWPRFRVSAEWPSGMSGGPVINANGNVIGLISRGWTGEPDSTATHFAGWNIGRRIFGTLDPFAVHRFRGFAALDEKGTVHFLGPEIAEATEFAAPRGQIVLAVSCNPDTGEWTSLEGGGESIF